MLKVFAINQHVQARWDEKCFDIIQLVAVWTRSAEGFQCLPNCWSFGLGRKMLQHHPTCRGMHKKWWRSLNYWSSVSGRWMLQHHPACRGMGEKCCRSSASISMLTTGRTKNSSTSSNLSRLGRGMLTVFGMINDIIVGLSEVKRGDHCNTIILYDWTVTPLHYLQLFLYHGGR